MVVLVYGKLVLINLTTFINILLFSLTLHKVEHPDKTIHAFLRLIVRRTFGCRQILWSVRLRLILRLYLRIRCLLIRVRLRRLIHRRLIDSSAGICGGSSGVDNLLLTSCYDHCMSVVVISSGNAENVLLKNFHD